jgi:D-serine deaminase-like pyridoxal phosphate-dependent protein
MPAALQQPDRSEYHLPENVRIRTLSPALVIFLQHVRWNLRCLLDRVAGQAQRWRPHVKTAKLACVLREYLRVGIRQFKCATTREAAGLLAELREVGGGDLLVAYPHRGPALQELQQLARTYPESQLSVLCEDVQLCAELPAELSVFVDLNPGMNRTGLPLAEVATLEAIAGSVGERFRGLHFYEGHLHDECLQTRQAQAFELYEVLLKLRESLLQKGLAVAELVTSGTPAFDHALNFPGFQELGETRHTVSPGTVVYHDVRSAELIPQIPLKPAALVFARVVSHPAADLITCDAGSKSVAAEQGDPCVAALFHSELLALTPSEEHLPFRVTEGPRPARGTELLLVPRHVCPTVNLAEQAWVIDPDSDEVSIQEVTARAHDLQLRSW